MFGFWLVSLFCVGDNGVCEQIDGPAPGYIYIRGAGLQARKSGVFLSRWLLAIVALESNPVTGRKK